MNVAIISIIMAAISIIISWFSSASSKRSAIAAEQANEDNRHINIEARRPWISVVNERCFIVETGQLICKFENVGLNPLINLKINILDFNKDLVGLGRKQDGIIVNPLGSKEIFTKILANSLGTIDSVYYYIDFSRAL